MPAFNVVRWSGGGAEGTDYQAGAGFPFAF